MKKLEIEEMEMINGGMNQRNRFIAGLGIVGGAIVGYAGYSKAWGFAAASFFAAVSGDCF